MALAAEAWETVRQGGAGAPKGDANRDELEPLRGEAAALLDGRPTFHWPLEFPEVFIEDARPIDLGRQPTLDDFGDVVGPLFGTLEPPPLAQDGLGFAAIVGNPPFQGGKKITGALGISYRDYLVEHLASGVRGHADLCAYFFLRAGGVLRMGGHSGLIATNTIAQGDTREVGLDQLADHGFAILRAVPSQPWPGLAAVEVAHVWLRRGMWQGSFTLADQSVAGITSLLSAPGSAKGTPHRLKVNGDKSFIGSFVLGMGFVLTPQEAQPLIAKNPRNREALAPYLNGEDLNSRPDQSPSRWVINFHNWSLEKAESYPDLISVVRERVKPERTRTNEKGEFVLRKPLPQNWWLYADRRPALYAAIANIERVLVIAQTSKTLAFEIMDTNIVYSHMLVVFSFDNIAYFNVMQSSIHTSWVLQYASSLKGDARYIPSDCFETFPFPASLVGNSGVKHTPEPQTLNPEPLEEIGEVYHEYRRQVMLTRQEGLTKTYNRFHSPDEASEDIAELRRLHVEMDQAVAAAYGWSDLDLGHGFHQTKQGLRYTISEAARRTVLDRLLALNHQRYAEEVALGLHDKGVKKVTGRTKKQIVAVPPASAPQLTLNLDEPTQAVLPPSTGVIDFQEAALRRATKKAAEAPIGYDSTAPSATQLSSLDRHVILLARTLELHKKHGFEKTLGHVKAEKIVHLVEAHCGAELERVPVRETAGPADFRRLLDVIKRGKHLGAFQDKKRPGDRTAYQFVPLGALRKTAAKMDEAFGPNAVKIDNLVESLVGLNTDQAEIVATLYAVWNDLLADGVQITDEQLFAEFYAWSTSKRNYQRGQLLTMKLWMIDIGLVPSGTAKRTRLLHKP
jgi:hypothetical protein